MARIRSVHPGLATDEAYMQMSAFAKAAWPILWTECDDQGVFEWKPVVLKARILPADNVDFDALLSEWLGLGCVMQFESGGKSYGAVRNFRRYQRPKKPNSVHPFPPAVRTYVGLTVVSSEAVPNQGGTEGENSPQMEDEGGRMETPSGNNHPPVSASGRDDDELVALRAECLKAIGQKRTSRLDDISPIKAWIDAGYPKSHVLHVLKATSAKAREPVQSWRYFQPQLEESLAKQKPPQALPAKPRTYLVEQRGADWFIEIGSPEHDEWVKHSAVGGVRDHKGRQVIVRPSREPPPASLRATA